MKMRRTFYPVGQGAFFTEVFYDKKNPRKCFTVVYDCGTLSTPEVPFKVSMCDSCCYQIDYFFVSHLDADHVNGVEFLINMGWLSKNTTIVLPYYENYQIELLKLASNRDYSSLFSILKNKAFNRVYFVPNLTDDSSSGDVIDMGDWNSIDNEDENSNSEENPNNHGERNSEDNPKRVYGELKTVMGLEGYLLKANSVFRLRDDREYHYVWEYMPFTMNDEASLEFYKKVEESAVIKSKDIEDIFNNVFKNGLRKNRKLKEIKRIYNSVGSRREGDTLINVNSLVVVSQSIRPICDFYICYNMSILYSPLNNPGYKSRLKTIGENHAVCVYTGDLNLRLTTDFDKFNEKLRNHCFNEIGLIQLPHHGSATSYNERLAHISIACFTNFDSRKKVFDKNLPFEFANNNKLLFLITERYCSRFNQEIDI